MGSVTTGHLFHSLVSVSRAASGEKDLALSVLLPGKGKQQQQQQHHGEACMKQSSVLAPKEASQMPGLRDWDKTAMLVSPGSNTFHSYARGIAGFAL